MTSEPEVRGRYVKEAVFPFVKFPGEDPVLGPEMRSTGEVMGIDKDLGVAFEKSYLAAGLKLPKAGRGFISVKNTDKRDDGFLPKLDQDAIEMAEHISRE